MQKLLDHLYAMLPDTSCVPGEAFRWSPLENTITYRDAAKPTSLDKWALLHEAGHALLGHASYSSDVELLLMEVAAWEKAEALARELHVAIDPDHIQDCLDTYRDWLHQRSTCPVCITTSLQINSTTYRCHNCTTEWHVTPSRFCRPYRRRALTAKEKKSPEPVSTQTTFM